MPRFTVQFQIDVEVEIDPIVIDRAFTDDWQDSYYDFFEEREVVEHLTSNIVFQGRQLSQLDGWADLPDNLIKVRETDRWSYAERLDSKDPEVS